MQQNEDLEPSVFVSSKGEKLLCYLRLRRHEARMTQEDLAAACSTTRHTIISLEQGKSACSLPNLFKLAEALGVDVCDIYRPLSPP
jgi:putative transcriptional regulator